MSVEKNLRDSNYHSHYRKLTCDLILKVFQEKEKKNGQAAKTAPNEPQTLSSPSPRDKGQSKSSSSREIWSTKLENTEFLCSTVHRASYSLAAQDNIGQQKS